MKIPKFFIAILLIIGIWVSYQFFTKYKNAGILLRQTKGKLKRSHFTVLYESMGKGYRKKVAIRDGKKYWVKWKVEDALTFRNSETDGRIKSLSATGSIDFIEIIPGSPLRIGYPFRVIKKEE